MKSWVIAMNKQSLSRREFYGLCLGLVPGVTAIIEGLASAPAFAAVPNGGGRTVKFPDGTIVAALGQGSWHLGEGRHPAAVEEEALRTGISLGMTLIDTAEGYAGGHSEELIGRAIAGQRGGVFLVSKVPPAHAAGNGIARACEASLARLGTDHLDLYLLHWRGEANLSEVVTGFESLRAAGKIHAWGYPTSVSMTWKTSSASNMATAAQPIRSLTAWARVALNWICCRGANNTPCR